MLKLFVLFLNSFMISSSNLSLMNNPQSLDEKRAKVLEQIDQQINITNNTWCTTEKGTIYISSVNTWNWFLHPNKNEFLKLITDETKQLVLFYDLEKIEFSIETSYIKFPSMVQCLKKSKLVLKFDEVKIRPTKIFTILCNKEDLQIAAGKYYITLTIDLHAEHSFSIWKGRILIDRLATDYSIKLQPEVRIDAELFYKLDENEALLKSISEYRNDLYALREMFIINENIIDLNNIEIAEDWNMKQWQHFFKTLLDQIKSLNDDEETD